MVIKDTLFKVKTLQLRMLGGNMHAYGVLALESRAASRALVPHSCPDVPILHMHPQPVQRLEEFAIHPAEEPSGCLH